MTAPEQGTPEEHVPVNVAASAPDPAIAPGVDPDVDSEPDAAPDVAVRNVDDDITVIGVGLWPAGEVKQVPAWLAARLLQSPSRFVEADMPTQLPAEPDTSPAKNTRKPRTAAGDEPALLADTA